MKTKNKGTRILLSIILLLGLGMGVKMTADKIYITYEVKKFQESLTTHIVENYEGITKIEWKGWEISQMGTVTTMVVLNDLPGRTVSNVFLYYLRDSSEIEIYYNLFDRQLFVDKISEQEISGKHVQKQLRSQGVKKSPVGSENVEIIYNTRERDIWL